MHGTTKPPRCPSCGARIRPDVVWFGEPIPRPLMIAAGAAAGDCDLFIAVGTSAIVQPAASLALAARDSGALVVEVNPEETALDLAAGIVLREPAGKALPALVAALG